ncbi:primosomal protein N' [Patescibacteria group bacterium]|nr:primosomal protein N' [Patescibacteria group bacterium]
MKIINVVPISKIALPGQFSYFTSKNIGSGALVSVPVRGKIMPAVVINSQDLKKIKTDLRTADFSLKSIKNIKSEHFLMPEFIIACQEIAGYFTAPLGQVLKEFLPQATLDYSPALKIIYSKNIHPERHNETSILQSNSEERLRHYRSIIREEFAKNYSVFFCAPSVYELEEILPKINKGIEKYAILMYGSMPIKKIRENWANALKEKHPVLILATKSILGIPRQDIGTLIIEGEGSPFYKNQNRPYIDIRKSAEIIAVKKKINLIFGDDIIRTETFSKYKIQRASRILSEAEQIIVDMNRPEIIKNEETKRPYQIISKELENILKESSKNGELTILFMNRKGYTPLTICNDCLRVILCDNCDSPLVLHKNEGEKKTKFICHKCLTESSAPEKCPYCQSWKLKSLGAGTQRAYEEIEEKIPNIKLFRMDSEIIKKKKDGVQLMEKFFNTPGAVLIGTELIFSFTDRPVERTAVISIDPLFTLPDFRINERIFQILLKLRSLAKKTFLIQTRVPEQKIFKDAMDGNLVSFYQSEIEAKKKLSYPPFKTFIKITKEGRNKDKLQKEVKELNKKLEKWDPLAYSAFIPKIKSQYVWHIIIKLEPESWPLKELHDILSSLTQDWKINVDPESLL